MEKIAMVTPFISSSEIVRWTKEEYKNFTDVDVLGIEKGKDPIILYSDMEFNIAGVLEKIIAVEKEGYKAVITACFGDPGLLAARQLVSIPVVGVGESSLAVSCTLGDRILLIEPAKDLVYITEQMVRTYGYESKVVSVQALDVTGAEACISHSEEGVLHVSEMCLAAVRENNIHVIIFGCIGLGWMVQDVRRFMKKEGVPIPIIEPGAVAIEYARMLLRLGLNQSREMFRM